MSRRKPVDNSTAVTLFPFLAVLLCTMGALVVVLVAMTRSAREVALRRTAVSPQPEVTQTDPAARDKLNQLEKYVDSLNQVRAESERRLRQDHQRLSQLEAHMRKLREQFEKLEVAAAELEALEDEHYDDHEQAQREIARLQQLISQTRTAIESLKADEGGKKKTYALVPYEGPNGTLRRPIYVECHKGELILQPEGVRIRLNDLRPPFGPGNALACALRAARDHLTRVHPEEAQNRDTEPYPLIVVRPSGAGMFAVAQRAIQSGDFDFGYELVEDDWDLKYSAPDPQLAIVEQQAIDQARVRHEALAAAAPRAYRHPALAAAGRFEFDDETAGFGLRESDSSFMGKGDEDSFGSNGSTGGSGEGDTSRGSSGESQGGTGGHGDQPHGAQGAPHTSAADETGQETAAEAAVARGGDLSAASSQRISASGAAGDGSPKADVGSGGNASFGSISGHQTGSPNAVQQIQDLDQQGSDLATSRGQDWALKRKKPRSVPIRRAIQIVVRYDHIAILSDESQINARRPTGKTIPLKGDTVESVDDFVAAVNEQIEGWGMAGDGLYWRPVLSVHVGPDGQRRAKDLARLLKNSGLELQPAATANVNSRGNSRATR